MLKLINDNANYCNAKRTFCEAMFAFLNVDHHGIGSVLFLNDTTGYTYIFTTGYICRYMRRNLVPLGGHFNCNRNGRIVELNFLYCHLFYLLSFCNSRGREITCLGLFPQ